MSRSIVTNLKKMFHKKCRNSVYPSSEIQRFPVPDDKISWQQSYTDYQPPDYNSKILINKPWADPDINNAQFQPKWNEIDGKINRKSYMGIYEIVDKRPRNPMGRTGIQGRGILGKWGPNHAADPIVTRWHIDGTINNTTNKRILQFCGIERHDCNQWAIPGGMVDPNEQITETLKREFMEEAFNILDERNETNIAEKRRIIEEFFCNGHEIYRGYVDDPRNTDNAWMETVAVNFHDGTGEIVGKFQLKAGDDAKNVKWIDIDRNLNLYASHLEFIENVAKLHKAHW